MDLSFGIKERLDSPEEQQRSAVENQLANMRVAIPGIIVSFNPENQTASVQPAITENIQIGDMPAEAIDLPVLADVPIQFPRAGGYCLTFPVKEGDECLVVFGDMCIDGWWQSGGIQDQMETRRHDLSDAIAILGITSVPRAVTEYATDSVMLRNEDKDAYLEIKDDKVINIKSIEDINVETQNNVSITAAKNISITAAQSINIDAPSGISLAAAGDIGIKSAGNITFESAGTLSLKGSTLNLN